MDTHKYVQQLKAFLHVFSIKLNQVNLYTKHRAFSASMKWYLLLCKVIVYLQETQSETEGQLLIISLQQ